MSGNFTESVVEDAALAWLESLGYSVKPGPEIASGDLVAERTYRRQIVLAAVVAKNATVRFRRNVQNMHIAVSKKATACKREIVGSLDGLQ